MYEIYELKPFENMCEYISEVEIVEGLQIRRCQIDRVKKETSKDDILQDLIEMIKRGWPEDKRNVKDELKHFWYVRDSLTQYMMD
jgi:hypothetical protein